MKINQQPADELVLTAKRNGFRENLTVIPKAYEFAQTLHQGQKRLSGEDFISHPIAVAKMVADWRLDPEAIAASLLHDVVEDTPTPIEKIKKNFGEEVANMVDGVTKIGNLNLGISEDEEFVENLRKLIVVMAKDLRVVLIKLADRYHNLQTLYVFPEEKQKRIARQTMDIYAPLAERLGLGEIKGKLEDLSFSYLEPEEYRWVVGYSSKLIKESSAYLEKAKKYLLKKLSDHKLKAEISIRTKHIYSLYTKLNRLEIDRDINKVYDLHALRILVDTIEQCYLALGVVHQYFKPVPAKGVSDFIAQPKPNGYRSVHTTVFALGKILEIQIRTRQMHEEAENGIAAHWYYSLKKSSGLSYSKIEAGFFAPAEKMSWVKELVRWQSEIANSQEFVESLKFDALQHRIFVYSPKGAVFDLPFGATPVDFAYAVHSQLGDSCIGAKVDGKLVSLDFKLKSGQIVEILVNKNKSKPSRDWLKFVVTKKAIDKLKKVAL